ncbi:MAG: L,D-transpeptidase family protein, partial [Aureliella sp.]
APPSKALTSTTAPGASLPGSGSVPPGMPSLSLPGADASKSSDSGASVPSATLPGSPLASTGGSDASTAAGSSSGSAQAGGSQADKTPKPTQPYKVAREEALKLANDGKLRDALAKMSIYYNHIELTREEQLDLIDLLDALAAEVIYSKRHLLQHPFTVSAGETLEGIANRFHVSPEVLAKINLMGDSKIVLAGTQLKVLEGPFRADVNLTRGELTLFLGDLYAGRFPVSIGSDPAPTEGTYQVMDRRRDRTYYGAKSQILPATDPHNPYGGYWLSLGKDLCIHGSPEVASPELSNAGCISLAPLDARDVYSLLTQGSEVRIHR